MKMLKKGALLASALVFVLAALCACTPKYTVTFDLNGGELVSGELVQQVKEGETAAVPQASNGSATLTWDKALDAIIADTQFRAKWTQTVTFDLSGGELVSGELSQTVEKGSDAVAPEATNGTAQLVWDSVFADVNDNIVVKASWLQTVAFDLNGGELVSGELSQTLEKGSAATAPQASNGTAVLGWDADFSQVTDNITIKAVWTQTVIFDIGGGTLTSGELTQTVVKGGAAVAPEATNGRLALTWDKDFSAVTDDLVVTAAWVKVEMNTVELAAYVQERTVTVNVSDSSGYSATGSGFFIDSNGTVVTNYHVIDGAESISVLTSDGGKYDVTAIIDFSVVYDLALLKIDLSDTPYLEFSTDEAKTGQSVYAVGSALGTLDGTFTAGIVSSANRKVDLVSCVQTDAAISPGNSGGPLVDVYGDAVGICAFCYTNGENLNFAIKPAVLDNLARNKNYTVTQYHKWYTEETGKSYTLYDGVGFYYSLINTYTVITGRKCAYSVDEEGNITSEGYDELQPLHVYDYSASELSKYEDYLKSIGFSLTETRKADGVTYNYYTSELAGVTVALAYMPSEGAIMVGVFC